MLSSLATRKIVLPANTYLTWLTWLCPHDTWIRPPRSCLLKFRPGNSPGDWVSAGCQLAVRWCCAQPVKSSKKTILLFTRETSRPQVLKKYTSRLFSLIPRVHTVFVFVYRCVFGHNLFPTSIHPTVNKVNHRAFITTKDKRVSTKLTHITVVF